MPLCGVALDIGATLPPLDGAAVDDPFLLDGLTSGTTDYDAVFLSHHHGDHCGLLRRILPGIPIYAGRETTRVMNIIADFTNQSRPDISVYFENGVSISIGDIEVTPYLMTHSAIDAYMFLIRANVHNILYTGDYSRVELQKAAFHRTFC